MFVAGTVVVVQVQLEEAIAEDREGFGERVRQGGVAPLVSQALARRTVVAGFFGKQGPREMGVARVQAEAYGIEVTDAGDLDEVGGCGEVVIEVFEQKLDTERGGEGFEVLDGSEGQVEGLGRPSVISQAEVQHTGAEGDLLCGFEGALGFVHGEDAITFVAGDKVECGFGVTGPLGFFSLCEEGHVHGGLDGIGTKPKGEVADGVAIAVIEVVTRRKDLNHFGAGAMQRVKMTRAKAVGEDEVRGDA